MLHLILKKTYQPSDNSHMKNLKISSLWVLICLTLFGFSASSFADSDNKPLLRRVQPDSESFDQATSKPSVFYHESVPSRKLASGNTAEDLSFYSKLERRLGVDVGVMAPLGDFQKSFTNAPMIGLHFTWEAIAPFALRVSTHRASAYHKSGAASGKLTVSSINIGTQASFPINRFIPFLKFEGSFNFNDVSFDSTKVVTAGSDTFVTTVGLNVGLGMDFIVGREMSFGFEGTYHYLVPKKINLSDNSMFDLGSSYASVGFRVNF